MFLDLKTSTPATVSKQHCHMQAVSDLNINEIFNPHKS